MLNRLRKHLEIRKPISYSIIRKIPLILIFSFLLLRISLGLADPGLPPPTP